ncbi:MAG TPA: carbohydrate kinase [Candidatus Dormibacteraeota bacterium]|nr:carbohydrate kinase [Candidatus Dormibacteraeota bacterium]
MRKRVVGLGEVLWDLLPERTCLGGAPANFAYITTLMGDQGIVASCVGEDSRGLDALRRMEELGLDIDHVQTDRERPTGTVKVELDSKRQPRFQIAHPVAWDFLQWTLDWQHLAEKADAVCFGSLAQRSEMSRETIRRFLSATSPDTVKVFDVNLRQSYYSQEILAQSMKLADVVKLNDDELPKIMSLSGIPHRDELSSAQRLLKEYDLKIVCVTRGGRGSLLARGKDVSEHPGFKIRVADTVGSGDAFTAGLVHEYLHGASLNLMNEVANLVGAWVASEVGAMPTPKRGALEHSLAEIR